MSFVYEQCAQLHYCSDARCCVAVEWGEDPQVSSEWWYYFFRFLLRVYTWAAVWQHHDRARPGILQPGLGRVDILVNSESTVPNTIGQLEGFWGTVNQATFSRRDDTELFYTCRCKSLSHKLCRGAMFSVWCPIPWRGSLATTRDGDWSETRRWWNVCLEATESWVFVSLCAVHRGNKDAVHWGNITCSALREYNIQCTEGMQHAVHWGNLVTCSIGVMTKTWQNGKKNAGRSWCAFTQARTSAPWSLAAIRWLRNVRSAEWMEAESGPGQYQGQALETEQLFISPRHHNLDTANHKICQRHFAVT